MSTTAERDAAGQEIVIRVGHVVERTTPGPRQRFFHLVDPAVDSYKSRFVGDGGDLSEHKRNPVWLWSHQSTRNAVGEAPHPDSVIGKVLSYDMSPRGLDVLVEFDEDLKRPDALCNVVWDKIQKGLIRACSVGAVPTERDEDPDGTVVFKRWTLKEGSSVILGGNVNCLVLNREAATAALVTLDVAGTAPTAVVATGSDGVTDLMTSPPYTDPGVTDTHPLAPTHPDQSGSPHGDQPSPTDNGAAHLAQAQAAVAGASEAEHDGLPARVVACVAAFDPAGRLLVGRRRDGRGWCCPGGGVEAGEPVWCGAARELRQEAGVEVAHARLVLLGTCTAATVVVHCYSVALTADECRVVTAAHDPDREFDLFRWLVPAGTLPGNDLAAQAERQEVLSKPAHPRDATLRLLGWIPGGDDADLQRPYGVGQAAQAAVVAAAVTRDPDVAAALKGAYQARLDSGASRGAVAHKEYPTVDGPWDAPDEVRRWRRECSSDGSGGWGEVDRRRFAELFGYVRGDGSSPSDYVLPHHAWRGGRLVTVWRGVVAAAAALQGARGGVGIPAADLAEVRAHIAAHYHEFGRRAPWEAEGGERVGADGVSRRDRLPIGAVALNVLELRADYRGVNWTLAPGVREELRRGLDWQREGLGGDGLVQSTLHDARRLLGNGAWWPEKARAARAWFARHGALGGGGGHPREAGGRPTPAGVAWALWGGDPGRRQVGDICARLDEMDRAERECALTAAVEDDARRGGEAAHLLRDLERGGDLYTLGWAAGAGPADRGQAGGTDEGAARSVATIGADTGSLLTSAVVPMKTIKESGHMGLHEMTRDDRMMHRGLIAHKLEGAEMHAQAREALGGEHEALRAIHRDQAHGLLEHASELHRAYKAGCGVSRDDDDEEGEVRKVPEFLKEEEMKRAFSAAYATIGRLPATAQAVCRDALGAGGADLSVKLVALADDRESLKALRSAAKTESQKNDAQQRDTLIDQWSAPGVAVIDPARALTMRGHDPATYVRDAKPTKTPWSLRQVQQYVAERQSAGPVADITRTAPIQQVGVAVPVPGAAPLQPPAAGPLPFLNGQGAAPRPANRVQLRSGGHDPASVVDLAQGAQQLAAELNRVAGPTVATGVRDIHGDLVQRDGVAAGYDPAAVYDYAARIASGEMRVTRPTAGMVQGMAPLAGPNAGMK